MKWNVILYFGIKLEFFDKSCVYQTYFSILNKIWQMIFPLGGAISIFIFDFGAKIQISKKWLLP